MFSCVNAVAGASLAASIAAIPVASESPDAPASLARRADREAIRGMAGAFRVSFRFEETVAVAPGYEVGAPYLEEATELVLIIADEPNYISLQHLLVVETGGGEPMVVKHWRQDWRYEDTDVLAFRGRRTWERDERALESVRGTWTQAVYQTTDAPRYEAVGRWTHLDGHSTWESETTWRPLPRRERHRDDYHVIVCRNRHTVTDAGWVHEQHNLKVALDGNGQALNTVAHEIAVNTYERVDTSAVAAAASYWSEHEAAWAEIRAAWRPLLERAHLVLRTHVDGERLSSLVDDALETDALRREFAGRLEAFVDG